MLLSSSLSKASALYSLRVLYYVKLTGMVVFSGPLNFAQKLIAIFAQSSLLCQIIEASLKSWSSEGENGSPSSMRMVWVFTWATLGQASGVAGHMTSVLFDSGVAALFLIFIEKVIQTQFINSLPNTIMRLKFQSLADRSVCKAFSCSFQRQAL